MAAHLGRNLEKVIQLNWLREKQKRPRSYRDVAFIYAGA
jgi:hypothetical protein